MIMHHINKETVSYLRVSDFRDLIKLTGNINLTPGT